MEETAVPASTVRGLSTDWLTDVAMRGVRGRIGCGVEEGEDPQLATVVAVTMPLGLPPTTEAVEEGGRGGGGGRREGEKEGEGGGGKERQGGSVRRCCEILQGLYFVV